VRVLEIPESPGILFWHFPGLESPVKLMQVLENPGNLLTRLIKFSLKTNCLQYIFGFLLRKVYYLINNIIIVHFKNLSESWKSPGKLFLKKGMNPGFPQDQAEDI